MADVVAEEFLSLVGQYVRSLDRSAQAATEAVTLLEGSPPVITRRQLAEMSTQELESRLREYYDWKQKVKSFLKGAALNDGEQPRPGEAHAEPAHDGPVGG